MNLSHIELSKLVISPTNMRAKRKSRDADELVPSVRARGVLVPLLVRPSGEPDMYEIVAGRRRFFAAKTVAEELGEPMLLPCGVMEPGDDAAALEASLLENVARLDADEVTQWETFSRLVKEGRTVDDIAATFGLEDRVVRRVLALGNLLPRIRTLYRNNQIDAATIRHLTMATAAQQREWLALYDSPDSYAPTGRVLKEWLFGGAAIPTSAALFGLSAYTAPMVADLFDDYSYFSDRTLFWTLQHKAVEEKRQAYLAEGWSEVVVLEDGRWFDRWAFEKRSRARGGRVYIAVSESGAVEVHEGYIPRKEAKRLDRVDNPPPTLPRPELTSPLRRYVDLHRHAMARARLLEHPWVALRLMVAHAIAGSSLWSVHCERQRADKPDTVHSVKNSRAQAVFDARRTAMLERLGLPPDALSLVDGAGGPSVGALFMALEALLDEEVLDLVTIVMGESLEAGGQAVEPLGIVLSADAGAFWEADDAFFVLLRDRQVLCALLEEVAGAEVARANVDAPTKVLKAILRDCLTGQNGRPKVDGWAPRWMRFPSGTYIEQAAPETPDTPEYLEPDAPEAPIEAEAAE